jgi:exosortase D (VPLPA-CTERM-specific)
MTKALAFPFLILAFIVPLPPFLNRSFTFKLKLISSALSVKIMRAFGLSAYREGNIIDLGLTQLQVVDACSGLRYVYPLFLMSLLIAYFFNKTWWERLLLVLAALPISIFSNALRIAMTGYLSMNVSPEMADTFFHGFSGWLIFIVSLALLSCLSWLLKVVQSKTPKKMPGPSEQEGVAARPFDLKKVRLSFLWIASIFFVVFWGLNTTLASTRLSPHRKPFEQFPTVIGDWRGEKMVLREEILDQLWADDYLQAQFVSPTTSNVLLLFISYYEYQGTRHTAHSPVSCLVGGGYAPRSKKIVTRDLPHPFGQVEIRQMVLEKNRALLVSNYWFQQRGRFIVSEYSNKWYLFWDSLTRRRTDGALVRLEMPLREGQEVRDAQATMDEFTSELMKILPQYVPN